MKNISVYGIKYMYSKNKKLFVSIISYILLSALLVPFQYMAIESIVNSVFSHKISLDIIIPILILVFVSVLDLNSETINNYFGINLMKTLSQNLNREIIEKGTKLSYDVLADPKTNDLLSRLSENPDDKFYKNIMSLIQFISQSLAIISLIIYFFTFSPLLTCIFFIVMCSLICSNYISMNAINNVLTIQFPEQRLINYYGKLLSEKNSIYELSVYGSIKYLVSKYQKLSQKLYRIRLAKTMKGQMWLCLSYIISFSWIAFVLLWSSNEAAKGTLKFGLVVAIASSSIQISTLADQIGFSFNRVVHTSLDIVSFRKFMDLPEELPMQKHYWSSTKLEDTIYIKDLTYHYPHSSVNVIDHLTMSFKLSECISLVGANGSGKTTLIKLLCGLLRPVSGDICIGNVSIYSLSNQEKKELFSVVFQNFGKYPLTVRENVALGNLTQIDNQEKIIECLNNAECPDFAYTLERSLDKIDEEGTEISGGEWQRLALARAMFIESKMMVLDEPTSALDPLAEYKTYKSIVNNLKHKGALMVSHRMGSTKLADRIYVLDHGKIVEEGTHEELIKNRKYYWNMYTNQAKWYTDKGEKNVQKTSKLY